MVTAKLRAGEKARYFEFLVDSGADYTVLIAKEEVESLLGRKGVFDHFEVIFREREGLVILKE